MNFFKKLFLGIAFVSACLIVFFQTYDIGSVRIQFSTDLLRLAQTIGLQFPADCCGSIYWERLQHNSIEPLFYISIIFFMAYIVILSSAGLISLSLWLKKLLSRKRQTTSNKKPIDASTPFVPSIVMDLLSKKATESAPKMPNETELIPAASAGQDGTVRSLIKAGTNLDIQNEYGRNALMIAAFSGNTTIADTLIKAGASLDIQDKYGDTGLMLAAYRGHKDIADALINAGANLDIQNNAGATALRLSSIQNNMVIASALLNANAAI